MSNRKLLLSRMVFFIQFWLVFMIGGTLQVIGVVTKTKLTIILSAISFLYFFVSAFINKRLRRPAVYFIAAAVAFIIVLSWQQNHCSTVDFLGSLLLIFIPLCFYFSTTQFIRFGQIKSLLKLCLVISVIQLPVMVLQRVFYQYIAALSHEGVPYIDIAYGTFFFKDDHALGFFLLCLIVFVLFNKNTRFVVPYKLGFLAWWVLTIFATNSKLSGVLCVIILSSYISQKLFHLLKLNIFRRNAFYVACTLVAFMTIGIVAMVNTGLIKNDRLYEAYDRIESQIEREHPVPRYGPLVKFVVEPVSLLGKGLFSYYNPITKQWGIRGGHSQWYSIYYNFGVLGLIAVFTLLLMMALKVDTLPGEWIWYLFMIMSFGLVTQFLMDPAMLITLFIFLHTGTLTTTHMSVFPGRDTSRRHTAVNGNI